MNLDHYRNFICIVECGTFLAASQKLLIAQPALSNQVKALEVEYGVQLLNRGTRKLQLTPAGEILYNRAKSMCFLEDSAKKEIRSSVSGYRGTLRLSLTRAAVNPYIEKLLLAFHNEYPGVNYQMTLDTSIESAESLRNGNADIAFIRVSDSLPSNLSCFSPVEECLFAYYSNEYSWISANESSFDIAALKDVPLSMTEGLKQKMTTLCQQSGFNPYIFCTAATRDQALLWARNNSAVTVLFCNSNLVLQEDRLTCCKITSFGKPITAFRAFVTCRDTPLSATAGLFLDFVNNYAADDEQQERTLFN